MTASRPGSVLAPDEGGHASVDAPASGVAWSTEVVLFGSGVFGNLAMSALAPALPSIRQSFAHLPDATYLTTLLVSVVGIATIAVSPFVGTLVRWFGRRRLLIGAYATFLAAGLVGMWLSSIWLIIASRVLTGAAGAVIVTLGITLIGDIYKGRPCERRIGANHAIGALLLGLLVPLAGYLADFNWRWAFLVHLFALPLLISALLSPDIAPLDGRAKRALADHGRTSARLSRPILALCALTLVAGGVAYSVQIYVPFHLRTIGSMSAGVAGAVLALMAICSIVTSLLHAEIRRFLSPMAVFALVFAGWTVGLGTVALAHSVTMVCIGMAIQGLAGGLLGPNLFSLVAALTTDKDRAHTVGIIKGIYYAGPFVGPALLQFAYAAGGPAAALIGMSGASLLLCLVSLGLRLRGVRTFGSAEAQAR